MGESGATGGEFALIDWIRRHEPERPVDPWTRVGIGDDGPLGGSLVSGRHLKPEPEDRRGPGHPRAAPIHAMIDLSDGLSSDLGHILAESGGLGAVLDAVAIPIHPDAHEQARRDGVPPSITRSVTARTSSCA